MKLRGQLTIFIIIGILIVALVVGFFLIRNNKDDQQIGLQTDSITDFVQNCLEDTGKYSLYLVGLHGGYYISPEESTLFGVPYYSYENKINFPSKDKIESEISELVEDLLPACTDEFKSFSDFDIDEGEIKVNTTIKEDYVFIQIEYPIRVIKGEETYLLKEFNTEIPVRLSILHDASKLILDYQIENPGKICLSCLSNFQNENNIQINMQSFNESIVYEIVDKDSTLELNNQSDFEPENYKFKFAVKY